MMAFGNADERSTVGYGSTNRWTSQSGSIGRNANEAIGLLERKNDMIGKIKDDVSGEFAVDRDDLQSSLILLCDCVK